jgi:hypothetical protein
MYTPGAGPVTFEVDRLRLGCAMGIEAHFPELFAEYEPRRRRPGAPPRGRRSGAVETAKVREWAKGHGYDIKDRGRVPATSSRSTRRPSARKPLKAAMPA